MAQACPNLLRHKAVMLDPDLLEEFGVRVGDVVRVKLLSFVPSVLWLKQSHDNDRKLFKDLKFDMHEFCLFDN